MLKIFIILIVASLFPVGAMTLYGQGSEPRTLRVPADYSSIQAALDAASDGDTVLVGQGEYHGNLDFGRKDVMLRSRFGAVQTVLVADEPIGGSGVSMIEIGPGGAIEGFFVLGGSASFGGAISVRGDSTRIVDNIFAGNTERTGGAGAAIHGNGASPVIEGNHFQFNLCRDDQAHSGVVSFFNRSSPVIVNNLFSDNACSALSLRLPEGAAPVVLHNTIVRHRVGITVGAGVATDAQTYRNNLLVDNDVALLVVSAGEDPLFAWSNNLVSGEGVAYEGIPDLTGTAGNLRGEPLLVSPDTGAGREDFALLAGSAGIDAGMPVDEVEGDFDGLPRPIDGDGDGVALPDIGAYEFHPDAVRLALGWTLVGWNVDTPSVDALGAGGRDVGAIFAWDAGAQEFRVFSPLVPAVLNTLAELRGGSGIWLFSLRARSILLPASQAPIEIQLRTGFNLVAWFGPAVGPAEAAASLGGAVDSISRWNPRQEAFETWGPRRPGALNTLDLLRSGDGVWVEVDRDVIWTQR